jgi:hypothetical protein
MPVLDVTALNTDPEGLEFLRGVLGTGGEAQASERRFPIEAWTPRSTVEGASAASQAFSDEGARRFADAAA